MSASDAAEPPFGRHGAFALDHAGGQGINTQSHAGSPGRLVGELGCTGHTGHVARPRRPACRALHQRRQPRWWLQRVPRLAQRPPRQRVPAAAAGAATGAAAAAGAAAAGAAAAGGVGHRELATGGIGQVHHRATDLHVAVRATALCAHGALALEGRRQQGFVPGRDARCPGGHIAELGRTSHAGRVAGHALRRINRFTQGQWAVGIAQLHRAHALDALCDGQLRIGRAHRGLVARGHGVDQSDDDEDGSNECEERRPQQLRRCLDRAGVVFVLVVAHGVLKGWRSGSLK